MSTENKVITGKCRLSYAHIWEPSKAPGSDKEKYSCSVIIPKSDKATLLKIEEAIASAKEAGKGKWGGKIPAKLKLPLRDGDEERPDDPAYAGCYFINANSNRQPGVLDTNKQEMLDKDALYSGCYCKFSLTFFPFDSNGNRGVGVNLNNILKVAEGERLSGGASAEDDFATEEVESDDLIG